jgi:predicted 3-demethylubiquinone-9 3-methyltransferase (glyoxalase superfamily)
MTEKIFPCFWFTSEAREAASFYCSVFDNAGVTEDNGVVTTFEVAGEKFMCLNGRTENGFNPSVSFYTVCETEEELDRYWTAFLKGGQVMMPLDKYDWSEKYGWVRDKYGISWQLSLSTMDAVGQKFSPTFMFTGTELGNAEKALQHYTSVFPDSSVRGILRYPAGQKDEGLVQHAQFSIAGYVMMCMDSSYDHGVAFNDSISFVVTCRDQEEIDRFWERLTEDGKENMCGWLSDRFGISWQIVPDILGKLMSDPHRSQRVMKAFMKMKKFNIRELENA